MLEGLATIRSTPYLQHHVLAQGPVVVHVDPPMFVNCDVSSPDDSVCVCMCVSGGLDLLYPYFISKEPHTSSRHRSCVVGNASRRAMPPRYVASRGSSSSVAAASQW